VCLRKLRADYIQVMPATNQSTIFCLPTCYPKIQKWKYTEPEFCLLFYVCGCETWPLNHYGNLKFHIRKSGGIIPCSVLCATVDHTNWHNCVSSQQQTFNI